MHDHRLLERLFERLAAGEGDRRELVAEVAARLDAHARAEEQEVYPALPEAPAAHAHEEHHDAEHRLSKVRNLIDSPHFDQALAEFVAVVRHHVEEEETALLPALRDAVDTATLARLGEAFEVARVELLGAAGFEEALSPAAAAEAGTAAAAADAGLEVVEEADELAEATRAELYELAREADIPGRSHMRKAELVEALKEQE